MSEEDGSRKVEADVCEDDGNHGEVESAQEEEEEEEEEVSYEDGFGKTPRRVLQRCDSLDIEAPGPTSNHAHSSDEGLAWPVVLKLAFQSIGIVYGDIGTSPLYVYGSALSRGIRHEDDVLGILSLILYTITLIPLLKYVFIVLRATDNGNGGTFALYSLICRYARVGLIPSQQAEDQKVSNFKLEVPSDRLRLACWLKSKLEGSPSAKLSLLFATMLGTSMVIGDGVLTPCISVLSAVGGIKEAASGVTEDMVVWTSVAILVGLFMFQRFGTDKVGYTFAPIICVWFILIASIGLYNFLTHDPTIFKALNPVYIVEYFRRNRKEAWISLGGVVLSITGTEALFADVGHFTVRSIQISMCSLVYPALVLSYAGQASFLRRHSNLASNAFFKSVPGPLYWPMFVVAVLAAIIASQAMISGTFSIIQQSLSLGCFPRVKIVHTSTKYAGQVYIPEINYLLMLACAAVTLGFRTTEKIGNAYGIVVVFVMSLTSALLVIIMIMIWKVDLILVIAYVVVVGSIELLYLSSVLYKFYQGGYLPLAFAVVLMTVMYVWNNVYRRKYHYELNHKLSPDQLREIIARADANSHRIPGLAIFYSELVQGIPPIFGHYMANVAALHSILVFVSIKSLPISKVPWEERFLFRRVHPRELNVFRCVVRYGYTDTRNEEGPFERLLVDRLKEYVSEDENWKGGEGSEAERIEEARREWVVHLVGESEVVAGKGSGIGKRVMVDYLYALLKRNLRQSEKTFDVPHERMLKVGMTYQL